VIKPEFGLVEKERVLETLRRVKTDPINLEYEADLTRQFEIVRIHHELTLPKFRLDRPMIGRPKMVNHFGLRDVGFPKNQERSNCLLVTTNPVGKNIGSFDEKQKIFDISRIPSDLDRTYLETKIVVVKGNRQWCAQNFEFSEVHHRHLYDFKEIPPIELFNFGGTKQIFLDTLISKIVSMGEIQKIRIDSHIQDVGALVTKSSPNEFLSKQTLLTFKEGMENLAELLIGTNLSVNDFRNINLLINNAERLNRAGIIVEPLDITDIQ